MHWGNARVGEVSQINNVPGLQKDQICPLLHSPKTFLLFAAGSSLKFFVNAGRADKKGRPLKREGFLDLYI